MCVKLEMLFDLPLPPEMTEMYQKCSIFLGYMVFWARHFPCIPSSDFQTLGGSHSPFFYPCIHIPNYCLRNAYYAYYVTKHNDDNDNNKMHLISRERSLSP